MERLARLALVLLAGCWSGADASRGVREPAGLRDPMALEISLERSPCFGTCPVFKLAIGGNGRVDWAGEEHVAARGKRTRWIARADLEELDRELERAQFFARDRYGRIGRDPVCVTTGTTRTCDFIDDTICSDTSSTILTVRRGGRSHRIENDHCSDDDPALDELERKILERGGAAAWIGRGDR